MRINFLQASLYICGIFWIGCGGGGGDGQRKYSLDISSKLGLVTTTKFTTWKSRDSYAVLFNDYGIRDLNNIFVTNIPEPDYLVLFSGSEKPGVTQPLGTDTSLVLRKSTNGKCFTLQGFVRMMNSFVYTTTLIDVSYSDTYGYCGTWENDSQIIARKEIVSSNYRVIVNHLWHTIHLDLFRGGYLEGPGVPHVMAIIMSNEPLTKDIDDG